MLSLSTLLDLWLKALRLLPAHFVSPFLRALSPSNMIHGLCFLMYFEVFKMGKEVALAASMFCRSTGNSDTLHGYAQNLC